MAENALAVINTTEFELIQRMANVMVKSGLFKDTADLAQAVVKIMAGREMGLQPFISMTQLYIVQGKPVLGANALATLIKSHPDYNYRVRHIDNEKCEIEFFEQGESIGFSQFSMTDAAEAGLTNNPNWKKYRRNMLFARAISNGARWHTPGVFGGAPVYTPDEFGLEVDEEGDIIDAMPIDSQPVTTHRTFKTEVKETAKEGYIDIIEFEEMDEEEPSDTEENGLEDPDSIAYLTDDELVIYETPAIDFWKTTIALVDRYDNVFAAQNAAKKLNISSIPARKSKSHPDPEMERVKIYRQIRDHAAMRDEDERLEEVGKQMMDAALRD